MGFTDCISAVILSTIRFGKGPKHFFARCFRAPLLRVLRPNFSVDCALPSFRVKIFLNTSPPSSALRKKRGPASRQAGPQVRNRARQRRPPVREAGCVRGEPFVHFCSPPQRRLLYFFGSLLSALGRRAFCLAQEPVWIQNAILPAASAKERSRYGQQEQPTEAGVASAAPGGLFLLGFRLGSCFFMDFRRIPWSPRPMVLSPFRQTCLGRVNTRARSRQQKQKDLLEKVKGLIETCQ